MSRRSGKHRLNGKQVQDQTKLELEFDLDLELSFQDSVGRHLNEWDATITPDQPALESLEQMIRSHKAVVRSRLWQQLLLLWTVGAFVISGLMLALYSSLQLFMLLQIGALAVAGLFLLRNAIRKGERHKWTQ